MHRHLHSLAKKKKKKKHGSKIETWMYCVWSKLETKRIMCNPQVCVILHLFYYFCFFFLLLLHSVSTFFLTYFGLYMRIHLQHGPYTRIHTLKYNGLTLLFLLHILFPSMGFVLFVSSFSNCSWVWVSSAYTMYVVWKRREQKKRMISSSGIHIGKQSFFFLFFSSYHFSRLNGICNIYSVISLRVLCLGKKAK